MFIDLEGLDGSGKTTQADMLCARLEKAGVPYRKIKLPDYDSDSSILVRKYLRGDFGHSALDVNAYAASVLYTVDRYASFTETWRDDYRAGKLIFADRYTPANILYQMTKLPRAEWDGYIDWLFDLEYNKVGIPAPDRVIFMDMPVEVSQKLLQKRYNGDEGKKDVHEANVAFLQACREAALYAAEKCGWQLLTCAADGEPLPPETVNDALWQMVTDALGS